MASFATDLSNSCFDFQRLVWPVLCSKIGGELMVVEGMAHDDMRTRLDVLAGIDAWHIKDGSGMRGIGSRIQWIRPGTRPYNTFTIRKSRESGASTEFEKRRRAIASKDGWLFPHLTVHAYVQKPERRGQLLSLGIARTADLVEYILKYPWQVSMRRVGRDGAAEFYAVHWHLFRTAGYPMKGGCQSPPNMRRM